jgi:hypothetical protein
MQISGMGRCRIGWFLRKAVCVGTAGTDGDAGTVHLLAKHIMGWIGGAQPDSSIIEACV